MPTKHRSSALASPGRPGVIDPHLGVVRRAVNLGWRDLPSRTLLEERYGIATYIINDSHAAALAEYMHGGPHASNNLIVIKVSQGVGAGIILHGRPLYGDGFGAGEIGHLVVQPAGEPCTCGNCGCLETVAGKAAWAAASCQGTALNRRTARRLQSWPELVTRHAAGEAGLIVLVDEAGQALGVAVASLITGFNVETIVIAGRITQLGRPLLDAVRAEAARRALPNMVEETTIRFSSLGYQEMVLLGCSVLVIQQELGVV